MQSSKRQRIEAGHGQDVKLDQVHAPVPFPVAAAAHSKDGRDDEDPEARLNAAMLRARMLMATASDRKAAPEDEALSRESVPALAYQGYSPPYIVEAGEGSGIPPPPPMVALGQGGGGSGKELLDPSRATDLVSAELEPAPVSCVSQTSRSRPCALDVADQVLDPLQSTMYTKHHIFHTVNFTLHTTHYTLHTTHYTLCTKP